MANIIIYSTPTCVYCKMAKEFFTKNSVLYTDHNVAEDEQALREMIKKSGQMGVPVVDIDGKIFVGFDKRGIAGALNLENGK